MLNEGLSIIIPTIDRDAVFLKTLEALYVAIKNYPCEVIVINDSKNKPVIVPEQYQSKTIVFDNPKSGVASARNFGVSKAKYANLLFMDDDMIVRQESIEELNNTVISNSNTAINFNWIYPPPLIEQIKKTQFGRYLIKNKFTSLEGWSNNLTWHNDKIFEVDLVASYFLFINRENFNTIGGYNESFPHAGAEDFEFAKRLKSSNIKGLCNPLCMVWHNEEDRVDLQSWLKRKQQSAKTRKVAVELGNLELKLEAGSIKLKINALIYQFKNVLYALLKILPNTIFFDKFYFFIVNRLLAAYLYNGYFSNRK